MEEQARFSEVFLGLDLHLLLVLWAVITFIHIKMNKHLKSENYMISCLNYCNSLQKQFPACTLAIYNLFTPQDSQSVNFKIYIITWYHYFNPNLLWLLIIPTNYLISWCLLLGLFLQPLRHTPMMTVFSKLIPTKNWDFPMQWELALKFSILHLEYFPTVLPSFISAQIGSSSKIIWILLFYCHIEPHCFFPALKKIFNYIFICLII